MAHYFECSKVLEVERERKAALESFKYFGFVVVENVVDPQDVAALLKIYDEIVEIISNRELNAYVSHLMPHTWDSRIADFSKNQKIVQCTEIFLENKISLLHSQITFKPPRDKGFSIHQDNYYNCAEPPSAIAAVWLALDDADEENGALRVYPFSHQVGIVPVKKDWLYFMKRAPRLALRSARIALGADIAGYERLCGVLVNFQEAIVPPEFKPMTVKINSGSIGFLHGNLLHSSGLNKSKERFRQNLLLNYIRQGANFKAGILSRRKTFDVYS